MLKCIFWYRIINNQKYTVLPLKLEERSFFFWRVDMTVSSRCSNIGDPLSATINIAWLWMESKSLNFCSKPKRLIARGDIITEGRVWSSDCELPLPFFRTTRLGLVINLLTITACYLENLAEVKFSRFSVLTCWMSSSSCSAVISEI